MGQEKRKEINVEIQADCADQYGLLVCMGSSQSACNPGAQPPCWCIFKIVNIAFNSTFMYIELEFRQACYKTLLSF